MWTIVDWLASEDPFNTSFGQERPNKLMPLLIPVRSPRGGPWRSLKLVPIKFVCIPEHTALIELLPKPIFPLSVSMDMGIDMTMAMALGTHMDMVMDKCMGTNIDTAKGMARTWTCAIHGHHRGHDHGVGHGAWIRILTRTWASAKP